STIAISADFVKPPALTHGLLDVVPGLRHGFFTREGGVSFGIYKSLNCGVGSRDDRALVFKNRSRAMAVLGVQPGRLATPSQAHSATAVVVDTVWPTGQGPQADAVVTGRRGIALGVSTADCGPILFADAEARVIGAAHAGWRGALAGVIESTVGAMEEIGARRESIVGVLGPMISQRNYEVGRDGIEAFTRGDPSNDRFFVPIELCGLAMFALPGYLYGRLLAAGIAADDMRLCTYADPERFYSYRRATHQSEPDYGRLLSAIAIVE